MRMYFSVMLGVELKEGGRLTWEEGARTVHNPQMGAVQSVTNEDIIERVKDVLADVTKHDDTITWRVTDVIEGGELVLDGQSGTVVLVDERGGSAVTVAP